MKAWFIALTALVLALSMLSSTWSTSVKAKVQPSTEMYSLGLSKSSSSHQAIRDLQAQRKNPSKQVESCFRAIPPSKSNPTQNK